MSSARRGGNEFTFFGEYREIDPPQRVVQTFEFAGAPGAAEAYDRLEELLRKLA